ncbi:PP2C family protein-serine/threonine phosphatase [Streptomyces buecherae]|uniref:PP2C family protein-serine/threonine phosphatase n=1 Tax=Streptomyces buecherae TaxID=2763006 RepID=UPI001E565249|nr:PP2C family protein-serine/threonine phosphatase [Streptomyces buecherae]
MGSPGWAGAGADSPRAAWARSVARWLPAVLLVGGVVFDLLMPMHYTASPFLSAASLVAAPLLSLRGTAAVAATAAVTSVLLAAFHSGDDQALSVTEVVTVCTVALLALAINRVVRRNFRQLATVRVVAEAAQRAVLPTPPSRIGSLRIAARYVAAQTDARIGGDLFAVQESPHGVRAIIGDVRGKGLEAVEAVAVVIGAFREAAEQERTLEGLVDRLERALDREGDRRVGLDQFEGFTTAVLAEIGDGSGGLRLINRGHPPPLLLLPTGQVRELSPETDALPLGMRDVAAWRDTVEELPFPAGAALLLLTDGVTEARDASGRFYEPARRLSGRRFASPDALLDALIADVMRHTEGQRADDMALLALRRAGAPGMVAVRRGQRAADERAG